VKGEYQRAGLDYLFGEPLLPKAGTHLDRPGQEAVNLQAPDKILAFVARQFQARDQYVHH
jgi:hypothetical protein